MKKKIMSSLLSLLIVFGITIISVNEAKASAEIIAIDGSYLIYDAESIGYATASTRGVDLLNGYSKVVRMGPETIYAGGTTMANHTVKEIGIAVMVEGIAKGSESWKFVDGWINKKENADRVAANRQLTVEGDYYYRVRCVHSANQDISDSFTDGIYIEKK